MLSILIPVEEMSRFLANVYMLSPIHLLAVGNARALYSGGCNFRQYFYGIFVCWPSIDIHRKFYGDRPRGTPSPGGVKQRVAKYSDFGPIEGYISETAQDRR